MPYSAIIPIGAGPTRQITLYSATPLTASDTSTNVGLKPFSAALFQLETGAGTGTSPTCDVYIQTLLPDNTSYQDIVHFAQATTAATHQYASLADGLTGTGALQDGALSAGTLANCLMGDTIRVKIVIGGTQPSYASVKVYASFF